MGLLFAIPPGFASAIWPAAGIALAIYLKCGPYALLGAFIGSTLANLQVNSINLLTTSMTDWLLPLLLATGTLLQLIFAKYLVLRFLNRPIKTNNLKSILYFIMLIGPVACVIAATIGASSIALINDLPFSVASFIGFTWWVGDSIGTIFFAPLVLLLTSNTLFENNTYRWKIIVPSTLLFILVSFIFSQSKTQFETKKYQLFVDDAEVFSQRFSLAQHTIEQQLYALSGLFYASNKVSREEFAHFSQIINQGNVKLRALGWIPKVLSEQKEAFINQVKQSGISEFTIKKLASDGRFTHALAQDYYLPITYLEPQSINRPALGLDVSSHPIVQNTVNLAITTAEPRITPPIMLAQQQDKYTGVVIYYPLYKNNQIPISVESKYRNLLGLVEAVVEVDALLLSLYHHDKQPLFNFQVITHDSNNTETSVYNNGFSSNANFSYTTQNTWLNQQLTLRFSSAQSFEQSSLDWASWYILIFGCLLSTFGMIFIMLVTGFSRKLEEQVKQKTYELQKTNVKLQQANKAKDQFISNMSHEYRTPLNAVVGYSQIGLAQTKDKVAKGHFSQIMNASEHMLNIINDMLDLAKMGSGRIKLKPKETNLDDIIYRIRDEYEIKALQKSVNFIVHYPTTTFPTFLADAYRIQQVIGHLCANAIKFTNQGQIKVTFTLEPQTETEWLLICSVKDQGIGIDEKQLPTLFSVFTQADESATRQHGGTGLGLALVKELVDLMNGKITVNSEINLGSEFTISLPLETTVTLKTQPTQPTSNQPTNTVALSELFVLIVEDNEINQIIAQEQLKLLNIKSEIAANGKIALDYLAEHTVDLVLLDLHMPIMNGFETAAVLKADPSKANLPLIALTASVAEHDRLQAKALGIDVYLTKPFQTNDLLEAIKHYIKIKED